MLAAIVYAEASGCGATAEKAVAHTIINRIGTGYWKSEKTISAVISASKQYTAYLNSMYNEAMKYYDYGTCSSAYDKKILGEVMTAITPVYNRTEADFTHGAQTYFSPITYGKGVPYWAEPGNGYIEVSVSGVSTEDFRFYKLI